MDLNEVVVEFRVRSHCDEDETGEVVWQRKRARFSGIPAAMRQRLGGGVYELPQPDEGESRDGDWRPTELMEKVSRFIEGFPGRSQRAVRDAGLGKTKYVVRALDLLEAEGYVTDDGDGNRSSFRSLTPYRCEDTGDRQGAG